jgi:hypothetical protein
MDLGTGKGILANKKAALDIYDQVVLREQNDGELGILALANRELLARADLPRSAIRGVGCGVVAPDLKWLALSETDRGGVWDLSDGHRKYLVRAFRGADFSEEPVPALYADFPKYGQTERTIERLNLTKEEISPATQVEGEHAQQHGRFLVVTELHSKGWDAFNHDVTRTIRDARTGAVLWARRFEKEAPALAVEPDAGTVALWWRADSSAVREEVKAYPATQQRLAALDSKRDDYFIEVVDARTGKRFGELMLQTRKAFAVADLFAANDWVVIADTLNRVSVDSLKSGEQKWMVFGSRPVLSDVSGLVAVNDEDEQLVLYDIESGEEVDRFTFASPVILKRFGQEGTRLAVVTGDQTAYALDVARLPTIRTPGPEGR